MFFKVNVKFQNEPLMGVNGKFADVTDQRVFYMKDEELTKLQDLAAERGMSVEVLAYAPTSAKGVLSQIEQIVAAQKAKGHY